MRLTRLFLISALASSSAVPAICQDSKPDMGKLAIERSQLTLPGSKPFHIKLEVSDATNKENDNYNGTIEEFWAGPNKWRRQITAKNFSDTMIVNGDQTSEQ